jgi:DNA-binding NarL/FixJ family response regulator
MSSSPIRVVVVDDHALVREGVRALLGSVGDMEFVGEASNGVDALQVIDVVRPDVVLMDLHMPGLDGIEVTQQLSIIAPSTAVLVVSMLDDDASVFAALRAGAKGYVLKGAETDELLRSIRSVVAGEVMFGPAIAERVLELFARKPLVSAPIPFPSLTEREREVLDHVARGESNAEIARSLFLSPRTVGNHVSVILAKLHARDRTDVAIRARNAGLGGQP